MDLCESYTHLPGKVSIVKLNFKSHGIPMEGPCYWTASSLSKNHFPVLSSPPQCLP